MAFVDTTGIVWLGLMVWPALDFSRRVFGAFAASFGGRERLEAYSRSIFGGRLVAEIRDRPFEPIRPAPGTWGVGLLFLPQRTSELRAAQTALWTAILRVAAFTIGAWAIALTVASIVTLSATQIRALQVIYALALFLWAVRELRRPSINRAAPSLPLIGAMVGAIGWAALSVLSVR